MFTNVYVHMYTCVTKIIDIYIHIYFNYNKILGLNLI